MQQSKFFNITILEKEYQVEIINFKCINLCTTKVCICKHM